MNGSKKKRSRPKPLTESQLIQRVNSMHCSDDQNSDESDGQKPVVGERKKCLIKTKNDAKKSNDSRPEIGKY